MQILYNYAVHLKHTKLLISASYPFLLILPVILVKFFGKSFSKNNLKKITCQRVANLFDAAVTQMNNKAENRLVTIANTTSQLDGEAGLTFDGTILTVAGNFSGSGFFGEKVKLIIINKILNPKDINKNIAIAK